MRRLTTCLLLFAMLLILTGCEGHIIGMLDPKGVITYQERRLFYNTLALMMFIVIPVIVMSFTFVYHYQAKHRLPIYRPNWSHDLFLEILWWGIPLGIIVVLGALTWQKTHELDPFRRISGTTQAPLTVQVIALPWKWLFIYPQQHIATLNYLVMPLNQPVEYLITADNVPMSAFFIPQIGSQIYAMAGMQTKLNLLANVLGTYDGMNALFNGDGFSDMHFEVHVLTPEAMQQWFAQVKQSPQQLNDATYLQLLKPSKADKPMFYSTVPDQLYENVLMLYMNSVGTVHPRAKQAQF